MEMRVFSETESPVSFKIHRKSALASNLKSSISHKLLHFLGNYTDDVLAEYITVLVCNGKHQNQARDDLEAFLGERSAEFVSWLWDLLLKDAPRSNMTTALSDPKYVTVTSTHDSDADNDWRTNRLMELHNHGTVNPDSSTSKDEKFYHLLTFGCNPTLSNDTKIPEGVQHCPGFDAPLNEVNTKKTSSETCGKEIGANGNIRYDCLAYVPSRMEASSKISDVADQSIQCADTSKKIVSLRCCGLPNQLANLPRREPVSRNMPSFVSGTMQENPHPSHSYAANVSGRSLSPRAVDAVSHRNDKSRGCVWDRLGKPCLNTFVRGKTVDVRGLDIVERGEEVFDQRTSLLPLHDDELNRSSTVETPRLGKRHGSNSHRGGYRKSEHGLSIMHKLHVANNIGRKRHFGEIGTGPVTGSVSLEGENNMDLHNKDYSQDFKRSAHTTQASEITPNLISGGYPLAAKSESIKNDMTVNLKPVQAVRNQVVDVKLRLHQIETEMSKLRSRQAEMEKGGNSNLSSNIGAFKHPEEDIESRTVFVTNVHFAATKEALSLYFAKCGVVANVVILTDRVTAQPKGSAYITFASNESVDKAMELGGTSFFSRIIEVSRKAEVAAMTSVPAQHAGKPSHAQFSHINKKVVLNRPYYSSSNLQWRRESVSAPSEPSASTNIVEKGDSTSASMQQLPVSLSLSEKRRKASSSMETGAAA